MTGGDTRIVILSDIHLGPGAPQTRFRDAGPLACMLRRLADDPTELVLAGDVFDFLQCRDYCGFDPALGAARFEEIASNPDTATVLDALHDFARSPGCDVVVLSGNHDPEMALPAVREAFEAHIGRPGRIHWPDDRPLWEGPLDEVPVWGYAVHHGDQTAWIVHGDRWDPNNCVDRDAVAAAATAGCRVELPSGSHLVFEVLSLVKQDHGWVDEMKPEPAVLLMLLYLDPVTTWQHLQQRPGLSASLLRSVIQSQLHLGPLFEEHPGTAGEEASVAPDLVEVLGKAAGAALAEQPDGDAALAGLQDWLTHGRSTAGTLAGHRGIGKAFLRAALRVARTAEERADIDVADYIPTAAERFFDGHADLLVAGHTHGPRRVPDGTVPYLNTGTWLPVTKVPAGPLEPWIDRVERGEPLPSRSPRTAVVLHRHACGLAASLLCCGEDGTLQEILDD